MSDRGDRKCAFRPMGGGKVGTTKNTTDAEIVYYPQPVLVNGIQQALAGRELFLPFLLTLDGLHRVAHAHVLVVLRDDLSHGTGATGVKENEVLHHVQQKL